VQCQQSAAQCQQSAAQCQQSSAQCQQSAVQCRQSAAQCQQSLNLATPLSVTVELSPTRQPSRVIAAYLTHSHGSPSVPAHWLNCCQRGKHLIAFWEASWFVRNRTSMRYTASAGGLGLAYWWIYGTASSLTRLELTTWRTIMYMRKATLPLIMQSCNINSTPYLHTMKGNFENSYNNKNKQWRKQSNCANLPSAKCPLLSTKSIGINDIIRLR